MARDILSLQRRICEGETAVQMDSGAGDISCERHFRSVSICTYVTAAHLGQHSVTRDLSVQEVKALEGQFGNVPTPVPILHTLVYVRPNCGCEISLFQATLKLQLIPDNWC
jgi:hypothetical protein